VTDFLTTLRLGVPLPPVVDDYWDEVETRLTRGGGSEEMACVTNNEEEMIRRGGKTIVSNGPGILRSRDPSSRARPYHSVNPAHRLAALHDLTFPHRACPPPPLAFSPSDLFSRALPIPPYD
jgi:hypothetical protein